MTLDLQAVRQTAETIALQAADTLMTYHRQGFQQEAKDGAFDMVTEADKAAEALIVDALTEAYPDHHIVGEEGGGTGAPIAGATYRWYVDPLDGTTNFANGIPLFAVSLALTDAAMNPLVGVVRVLPVGETFAAVYGAGATLDGEPIQVGTKTALNQCVVASGFPYDKATDPDNNVARWSAFVTRTRGVRRMGTAATDLCYVAAGRFDGYWESKLHPWDCLAGGLLVREAGGLVTDYAGDESGHIFAEGRLIAANPSVHPLIKSVINEVDGG